MSTFLRSLRRLVERSHRSRQSTAKVVVVSAVGCVASLLACDTPPRPEPTRAIAAAQAPVIGPDLARDAAELARRELQLPVQGATKERLIPTFDEKRGDRLHEAIDILAERGTPVMAVEDGTLAKLFTSKQGGLTIYQFDPGKEYAYYYAHLDRYAEGLAEKQNLRRGQVIGYVGSTGNADARTPHLHFAIFKLGPEQRWWQGDPIDPYEVFTSAGHATR
jgi:murein DD-endopeptidase MepM/ murein hydrolase activator NlpD